jgi:hypothetical protein
VAFTIGSLTARTTATGLALREMGSYSCGTPNSAKSPRSPAMKVMKVMKSPRQSPFPYYAYTYAGNRETRAGEMAMGFHYFHNFDDLASSLRRCYEVG